MINRYMDKKETDSTIIGTPLTDAEREEDLLQIVYSIWQTGNRAKVREVCDKLGMSHWEYKRARNLMLQHNYLSEMSEDELVLTQYGMIKAVEMLEKKQCLTAFLQMVCNVEEQIALDNACRLEHVVSDEILEGVRNFMRNGDMSDRIIKRQDLHLLYDAGEYEFYMSMYETGKRYPRILCEEFYWFSSDVYTEVGEQSFFYLELCTPNQSLAKDVWYLNNRTWIAARKEEKGYQIPTDVFQYTLSGSIPVVEGDVYVAFTFRGREPEEADMRELNVHLW